MVLLPNWLDARHIPIENGSGDEEIPKADKNCRSSGKSRIFCQAERLRSVQMELPSLVTRRLALILVVGSCLVSLLGAEPDATRSRIALFEPAGQKGDTTLAAVLSTVANSVELSLDVLQRFEVTRLPPEDPATDLDQVRAYCQKNRIDQAVLGSGSARAGGGYSFRLVVYDRKTDKITADQRGASTGALDMFDVTDSLVASLLDALSGKHLLYGSLSVESDPAGAMISVNGKDVGAAPLSLRGLPVGTVELSARLDGYEGAKATVAIADGETTSSSLTLPRSMGVLAVAMPKDAVMTVGSAAVQKKVITGPGIAMLPAGDYEVEASCPGLPGVSAKVTITSGASTQWQPWTKGYLDVRSDPSGAAIVVDGVERGAAPLIVEVEPGTLHQVELRKENYETYHGTVSGEAGNKTLFSGTLTPVGSNPAPVVSAAVVPPASPDALPLPRASIKIDGKFDDWKDVPPVVVGSQDATDNMTISKVYLAADAKNFYIRLDIADKTPVSFLHPYNFRKTDDVLSYGITMESGDGRKNLSVRLFDVQSRQGSAEGGNLGWFVEVGVRDGDTFHLIGFDSGYLYKMSGYSAQISLPLTKIRGLLSDLGQTKRFRITGWTAKGGAPTNRGEGGADAKVFSNTIDDLSETQAGYFTF